jgi:hypothetical protein
MTAGMIEGSMASDPKDEVGKSVPVQREPTLETNQRMSTRRHPLFGALKGHVQVMPETDLTQPADPAWGNGDAKK